MCYGFSAVVTPSLEIYWAQPDIYLNGHHSCVADYLYNKNRSPGVQIECDGWDIKNWDVDAFPDYLPRWFADNIVLVRARARAILEKCNPAISQYTRSYTNLDLRYREAAKNAATSPDALTEQKALHQQFQNHVWQCWWRMCKRLSEIEGYVPHQTLIDARGSLPNY